MEITFKAVMEKFSWVPKHYNMFSAKADSWSFCQEMIILALWRGRHTVPVTGKSEKKNMLVSRRAKGIWFIDYIDLLEWKEKSPYLIFQLFLWSVFLTRIFPSMTPECVLMPSLTSRSTALPSHPLSSVARVSDMCLWHSAPPPLLQCSPHSTRTGSLGTRFPKSPVNRVPFQSLPVRSPCLRFGQWQRSTCVGSGL